MDRSTLAKKSLAELRAIAGTLDLAGFQRMKKADLVALIVDAGGQGDDAPSTDDEATAGTSVPDTADHDGDSAPSQQRSEPRQRQRTTESVPSRADGNARDQRRSDASDDDVEIREGVLDLLPEGYGFLRVTGYLAGQRDVYVSQSVVRRLDLRPGDRVKGPIRRNKNTDKFPALARVDQIEEVVLDQQELPSRRASFAELTAVAPTERFAFDLDANTQESVVFIDAFAPLARGQRGLVTGASGTGKSTVLNDIADAITAQYPDTIVMLLLLDERPEVLNQISGISVGSSCEQPPEDHTQIAELALERAKRLVERGHDVVVLLDSITRLARAYQATAPANTRSVGGLDLGALSATKRMFAQARALAEGGSLTIIAAATDDSALDADRLLLDELRQIATLNVHLDRVAAERQSLPAIDPIRSRAYHGGMLRDESEAQQVDRAKRALTGPARADAIDRMHTAFRSSTSPRDALKTLASGA